MATRLLEYKLAKMEERINFLLAEIEMQQKIEDEIIKEVKGIRAMLHAEGGPLHSNRLHYSKSQLFIFEEIDRLMDDLF